MPGDLFELGHSERCLERSDRVVPKSFWLRHSQILCQRNELPVEQTKVNSPEEGTQMDGMCDAVCDAVSEAMGCRLRNVQPVDSV